MRSLQHDNNARGQSAMTHEVGISEMKVTSNPEDTLSTRSLGSCIGVAIFDPEARVGGMLHFQLPVSKNNMDKAAINPCMYGDTGLAALLKAAFDRGARKNRMLVKIAGGARVADKNGFFNIGKRNIIIAKKFFWKNGIIISGEDTGGEHWRNMALEVASGRVTVRTKEKTFEI